jgi:hypothetical protein
LLLLLGHIVLEACHLVVGEQGVLLLLLELLLLKTTGLLVHLELVQDGGLVHGVVLLLLLGLLASLKGELAGHGVELLLHLDLGLVVRLLLHERVSAAEIAKSVVLSSFCTVGSLVLVALRHEVHLLLDLPVMVDHCLFFGLQGVGVSCVVVVLI